MCSSNQKANGQEFTHDFSEHTTAQKMSCTLYIPKMSLSTQCTYATDKLDVDFNIFNMKVTIHFALNGHKLQSSFVTLISLSAVHNCKIGHKTHIFVINGNLIVSYNKSSSFIIISQNMFSRQISTSRDTSMYDPGSQNRTLRQET